MTWTEGRNVRIRQPCWAVVVLDDHDFAPFDGFCWVSKSEIRLVAMRSGFEIIRLVAALTARSGVTGALWLGCAVPLFENS